jgi:hypothetical protein
MQPTHIRTPYTIRLRIAENCGRPVPSRGHLCRVMVRGVPPHSSGAGLASTPHIRASPAETGLKPPCLLPHASVVGESCTNGKTAAIRTRESELARRRPICSGTVLREGARGLKNCVIRALVQESAGLNSTRRSLCCNQRRGKSSAAIRGEVLHTR